MRKSENRNDGLPILFVKTVRKETDVSFRGFRRGIKSFSKKQKMHLNVNRETILFMNMQQNSMLMNILLLK